jgi:hypothetical protein
MFSRLASRKQRGVRGMVLCLFNLRGSKPLAQLEVLADMPDFVGYDYPGCSVNWCKATQAFHQDHWDATHACCIAELKTQDEYFPAHGSQSEHWQNTDLVHRSSQGLSWVLHTWRRSKTQSVGINRTKQQQERDMRSSLTENHVTKQAIRHAPLPPAEVTFPRRTSAPVLHPSR